MRKCGLIRGLLGTCLFALPVAGQAGSPGELLYVFPTPAGANGANPDAGVIADAEGNLYGTTEFGGNIDPRTVPTSFGFGTVFKLSLPTGGGTQWKQTVLYSFKEMNDGALPMTPLLIGKPGVLYGSTSDAFGRRASTVFALTPPTPPFKKWSETIVHAFSSTEGDDPGSALIQDQDGALYGVLEEGGPVCTFALNCGTVFKLTPPSAGSASWTETTLYQFTGTPDGSYPTGNLVMDGAGAFYGVTATGGSAGQGTVYKLTPPAAGQTVWTETILHNFAGFPNDGAAPRAGLAMDNTGTLYGTTNEGGMQTGSSDLLCADYGCGLVFKLTPPTAGDHGWTETVLYNFTGNANDGDTPGGIVLDAAGDLLGASEYRSSNCSENPAGLIFRLTRPGAGQSQWSESAALGPTCHFGEMFNAPLLITGQDTISATSVEGGSGGNGTVFRFRAGRPAAPGP